MTTYSYCRLPACEHYTTHTACLQLHVQGCVYVSYNAPVTMLEVPEKEHCVVKHLRTTIHVYTHVLKASHTNNCCTDTPATLYQSATTYVGVGEV